MNEQYSCGVIEPPPIHLCGGFGDENPANEEIQAICDEVKAEFFQQSGVNGDQFVAVTFKSQVVSGRNLFIKVRIGDEQYAHVRVYEFLPHMNQGPRLDSFQVNKGKDDDIEYF